MLIAQITDTHIVKEGDHWLNEPATATSARLTKAVSHINALTPLPDVVLLTGDASDTGSEAAYFHLKELLKPLKPPVYIIPGNHDQRETLRQAFKDQSYMPKEGFIQYVVDGYPVTLIGLDTLIEGKDSGILCEERFLWLKKEMEKDGKPKIVFMHHPPAKTGYRLFDSILCQVPDGFEEYIRGRKELVTVLSGHFHHFCLSSYGNKPCFIAPSVAPVHYFANPQDDFVTALEIKEPAITLHQWHEGNFLTSHIVYLKDEYQRIDWLSIKKKAGLVKNP